MATGKIARLPRELREQLNQRLEDGEPGKRLVAWLNELPAVRALLAAEFGGAAIKEQNLTNWKQGGFRDWRMEQQAEAFAQSAAAGGRLTGQQDGAERQLQPTPVTAEQLVTSLTIRYLMVVREWMQSPMPVERRWRQLRVMQQDVLKLQRGEHREQRLELDRERLEFAMERHEEEKQTDERRAMIGFLVAARHWPEVQEALTTAFRLFQERKEAKTEGDNAELGPIKVNQGGKNLKNEAAQDKLAGCSPSPISAPPGRGDNLGRFLVHESTTTSAMGLL